LSPSERSSHSYHIGWTRRVIILPNVKRDLRFWTEHIHSLNGQPILPPASRRGIDILINTDASGCGWGGLVSILHPLQSNKSNPTLTFSGTFEPSMVTSSSNYRELMAVLLIFQSAASHLRNSRTDLRLDNQGAASALGATLPHLPHRIFGGSNNPSIQAMVISIHDLCIKFAIDLHTFWIPRDQNKLADALSKWHSYDHYSFTLTDEAYAVVERHFGPHTIDRFASAFNVRVAGGRYNSLYFEPAAEGLDAFAFDWRCNQEGTLENNWIHPPYRMIGKALYHTLTCKARATSILPIWPSAHWWPLVQPFLHHFSTLQLGPSTAILAYPVGSGVSPKHLPRGHIVAVHIEPI